VGDSIPQQLAPYVAAALPQVDVRFLGGPGTGVLSDQGAVVDDLRVTVDDFDPDVVVVHYAGTYLRREPDNEPYLLADGAPVEDGSEAMFDLWTDLSAQLVDAAGSRGATVLWALVPQIGRPDTWFGFMADRVDRFNGIYRGLGVPVLDWYGLCTGPAGGYVLDLPGLDGVVHRARSVDGLHFTEFGNQLLAATVAEEVVAWEGRDDVPVDARAADRGLTTAAGPPSTEPSGSRAVDGD